MKVETFSSIWEHSLSPPLLGIFHLPVKYSNRSKDVSGSLYLRSYDGVLQGGIESDIRIFKSLYKHLWGLVSVFWKLGGEIHHF